MRPVWADESDQRVSLRPRRHTPSVFPRALTPRGIESNSSNLGPGCRWRRPAAASRAAAPAAAADAPQQQQPALGDGGGPWRPRRRPGRSHCWTMAPATCAACATRSRRWASASRTCVLQRWRLAAAAAHACAIEPARQLQVQQGTVMGAAAAPSLLSRRQQAARRARMTLPLNTRPHAGGVPVRHQLRLQADPARRRQLWAADGGAAAPRLHRAALRLSAGAPACCCGRLHAAACRTRCWPGRRRQQTV